MIGGTPAGLSAAEIAAEIARTRSRLSHSLAMLDREYALRHLFVRGLRIAHDGVFDAGSVAQGVRKDIVPVALISTGLAWIALAGRGGGGRLLDQLGDVVTLVQGLVPRIEAQAKVADGAEPRTAGGAGGPTTLPDRQG